MLQEISRDSPDKIIINKKKLIYFYKLIFVPTSMRIEIVAIYYNKLFKNYLKIKKIIELITRNYYILNLR